MSNAGLPEKPPNLSLPPMEDDIPVAVRDEPEPVRRYPSKSLLIGAIAGLSALMMGMIVAVALTPKPSVNPDVASSPAESQTQPSPPGSDRSYLDIDGKRHFAYKEAPQSELKSITPGGNIRLRTAAAKQYRAMVAAARANGVNLVAISGFRLVGEQQRLFFDVKAERGQDARKRAEVSAPPGYSEHHTGYAVDIGDGNAPATNLSPRFENTSAFKWLKANAARFSFEMSFPRNNSQGVNYEPWHWRYVGDRQSLETFYKAKNPEVK